MENGFDNFSIDKSRNPFPDKHTLKTLQKLNTPTNHSLKKCNHEGKWILRIFLYTKAGIHFPTNTLLPITKVKYTDEPFFKNCNQDEGKWI